MPTSYSLLLVSTDGIDEDPMILDVEMNELVGNFVKFSAQGLPRRRRWNYTVLAYECNQQPLTKTAKLSERTDNGYYSLAHATTYVLITSNIVGNCIISA